VTDNPNLKIPAAPAQAPGAGWFACLAPYVLVFSLVFLALVTFGLVRGGGTPDLLRGPDDMMRTLQVLDWLGGQDWTDTVQRRLDPPEGVRMHWSRLADLPLAALIRLADQFTARVHAVYLGVLLVPPILGAAFAAIFVWAAAPLAGRSAPLVPIMLIFALYLPLEQFHPGRVDHHGLQLVFAVLAAGLLFRAVARECAKSALWLGVVGGISLAIGLEALTWLGAVTIALSLAWVQRGGRSATVLLAFGAALLATAAFLMATTLPADIRDAAVCDRLSVAHVALAGIVAIAGAAACAFSWAKEDAVWPHRLAVVGGVGCVGLAVVFIAFPECAGSPYRNLPQELQHWFRVVAEARPLWDFARHKPGGALSFGLVPAVAFAYTAWRLATASRAERPMRLSLCVLVLAGLLFVTWQVRGVQFAVLFAAFGLVPLMAALNERVDRLGNLVARVFARVCPPLAIAAAILAPNALDRPTDAVAERRSGCDVRQAVSALMDPTGLGAHPIIIAAPIFVGTAILFHTHHSVLAAPYHRNVRGMPDNRRIFFGSEKEVSETIKRRNVGAILFCQRYARLSRYRGQTPFLARRLGAGTPPDWLVPVMRHEGLHLYRVRPAAPTRP
jgi:hypothetical protein